MPAKPGKPSKPINLLPKGILIVKSVVWDASITFKDVNGKTKEADNYEECREYAKNHGYSGIQIDYGTKLPKQGATATGGSAGITASNKAASGKQEIKKGKK